MFVLVLKIWCWSYDHLQWLCVQLLPGVGGRDAPSTAADACWLMAPRWNQGYLRWSICSSSTCSCFAMNVSQQQSEQHGHILTAEMVTCPAVHRSSLQVCCTKLPIYVPWPCCQSISNHFHTYWAAWSPRCNIWWATDVCFLPGFTALYYCCYLHWLHAAREWRRGKY